MATIHPPNTIEWRAGDYVIHDADTKCAYLLLVVLGRSASASGVYRTRYAYPAEQPKSWRHKVWRNAIESLHDPSRFGIAAPAVSLGARASAVPRSPSSRPAHDPTAMS